MTDRGLRDDLTSRRVIDVAIGILMGLRGCTERDAFDDLANAVRETGGHHYPSQLAEASKPALFEEAAD